MNTRCNFHRIYNNKKGKVWFDDVKIVKGNASQTVIVEESNYYPFGLKHKGYNNVTSSNGNSVAQKFGYNGKELNEELGLQWHDFSARNYDASLGRWMNLDPLAEQMRRHSPYNYAFNNPIYFIDPDGMMPMGHYSGHYGMALDDIIFNSVDGDGNVQELGRIVTDKFDQEINIDKSVIPFDIPENYEPVNVNLDANEMVSNAIESTGIQAFSLDVSGEAAFKVGVQLEVSLIGIVAGENKGDWGVTLQGNGLLGLEGSVTGSASAYWSLNGQDLSLGNLRGFEYGAQGSVFGVSGSYFEGFGFTSSYPFTERVYGGVSIGGSLGIPELGGSGSGYIGVSDFIYRSDKK
jgi:RHS repeat-associated protein